MSEPPDVPAAIVADLGGAPDGLTAAETADATAIAALMLGPLMLSRSYGSAPAVHRSISFGEAYPELAPLETQLASFGLAVRIPQWGDSGASALWPRCAPVVLPGGEVGHRVLRAAAAIAEQLADALSGEGEPSVPTRSPFDVGGTQ